MDDAVVIVCMHTCTDCRKKGEMRRGQSDAAPSHAYGRGSWLQLFATVIMMTLAVFAASASLVSSALIN